MSALTAAQEKTTDAFASATKDSSLMALNSLAPTQNTDYPKPHVQEAPSDTLDPLLGNPSGVHVEVAYPSMRSSDIIGLFFNGNDTFAVQNGSVFGTVTFLAPVADVTLAVGKTIQVIYAVVRPDGVILSEILNLIVQPIAADKLPTPQITQASEGVLDLTTFDGDADVTVEAWPLIAVGQTVWLTVSGPGGVPTMELLNAYVMTTADVSKGVRGTIARAELEKLEDGSELGVMCKVGFEGGSDEAEAVELPTAAFKTTLISFEGFETAKEGRVPPEQVESFRAFSISAAQSWVIRSDYKYPPYITGLMAHFNLGRITITLKSPAKSIRFAAQYQSGDATIAYKDEQELTITTQLEPAVITYPATKWIEYFTATRKIKSIVIDRPTIPGFSGIGLDNFTFTYI
ncbi:hypothetical protein QN412_17465 [Pseudomonas sp. RTB3]|nr:MULTISPECIES: hypothetical protein [unclassified Pseudomonas]MEB0009437.1 hypothetical protein [Pseudomonas sp. RTB2]MEB0018722.1 hypothetical protein [Pseudomonas sp. RTB3]MEB0272496.1 hypothetical protein [Pseudomonas sp. 5B4]